MASYFFYFLVLLSQIYLVAAQQRSSNISLGSSLTPTGHESSWLSPSGLYAFGFYRLGDGYAVGVLIAGIPEKTVVWTANRDNAKVPDDSKLLLSEDGRLIVQSPQGLAIIDIAAVNSASSASMLDSGNFVVYASGKRIIWQSFGNPIDTILAGQRLANGKELLSSASNTNPASGIFKLVMQSDGNLVQYPAESTVSLTAPYSYYASGTNGFGSNITLNLADDGLLYLFNSTANILNLTGGGYPKQGHIYRMKIDPDGIFRLYSYNLSAVGSNWSVLWWSTNDKCIPKGLCGLNAFCVTINDEADCRCIPGYNSVSPGNWTAGCNRNFTIGSCQENNINGSTRYEMRALENTVWLGNTYSRFPATTREDCQKACLDDCNCEVALFKDQTCNKQSLPLKYGRRILI